MNVNSKLTFVLVTHNSAKIIGRALEKLVGFNTIVYDNASEDDTLAICGAFPENVTVIKGDTNVGYGRAANRSFSQVPGRFAVLLNPDVGLSRCQILELEKQIEAAENDWLYIAPNTGHVVTKLDIATANGLQSIERATGCALLFDLDAFRQLGGFDENIFLYYEEMDLSVRAQKAGLNMYYAESVSFPHHSKSSVAESESLEAIRDWHFQWSSLYYKRKHQLWAHFLEGVFVNIFISPFKQIFATPERAQRYKIKRKATFDFLKGKNAFLQNGDPYIPERQQ